MLFASAIRFIGLCLFMRTIHGDILSTLVVEAALAVMPPNPNNFNVDNVQVAKIMGGGLSVSG